MHKGKFGLENLLLRPWMTRDRTNTWIFAEYEWLGINWYIHTGAAAPASDQHGIVLQDVDWANEAFTYYNTFTWNGQTCHLGFRCKMKADHTNCLLTGYLTVGGVQQNATMPYQSPGSDWRGIQVYSGNFGPAAGAVLAPSAIGSITFVPY